MRYLSFVFILFLLPKLQGQDSPAWDLLVIDAQIFTGTFATRDDLFIVPTALTYLKLIQIMKEQGTAMENTLDSASLLQEVVRLYEVGVDVLAGNDPPNFNINYGTDLYDELCLLKDAGIPAEDCLAGATALAATHSNIADQHRLEEGMEASFLVLPDDLLQNMESLYDLEQVWQKGKLIFDYNKE